MKAPITALVAAVQLYHNKQTPVGWLETALKLYSGAGDQLRAYSTFELDMVRSNCGVLHLCWKYGVRKPQSPDCIPLVGAPSSLDGCRNIVNPQHSEIMTARYDGGYALECTLYDQVDCKGEETQVHVDFREYEPPIVVKSIRCQKAPTCCYYHDDRDKDNYIPVNAYDHSQKLAQAAFFQTSQYSGECTVFKFPIARPKLSYCLSKGSVQLSGSAECTILSNSTQGIRVTRKVTSAEIGFSPSWGKATEIRCANNFGGQNNDFLLNPRTDLAC